MLDRYDPRDAERGSRQEFHAGLRRGSGARNGARVSVQKPRELSHDSRIYRAYFRAEARIRENGGRVRRVVLDHELKRDYQRFLQEGDHHDGADTDGRSRRSSREIEAWAREYALPMSGRRQERA